MKERNYNREDVVKYAEEWAYKRNPKYYNFDVVGGDCTSFASQCIFAGSDVMNYSQLGWYYKNGYNKSASWSGVEFLHNFLTNNKLAGPYGREVLHYEIEKGDIVQLSFDGNSFQHTLVIVDIVIKDRFKSIFVATHTEDSYYRDLSTYTFKKVRFIKIDGVREWQKML